MSETNWQAQWIWAQPQDAAPATRHYYFRRTFTVAQGGNAVLRVCADTRYRLWLNGRMLGHGPARSAPGWQYYDCYEVTLTPGTNTLCILATHYGIGTCYSCLGSPGLLVQVESAEGVLGTDAQWKCAPAPYATHAERMSIQLAYPELFDFRAEPQNWNLPGFDDSTWGGAVVLGAVGREPWGELLPRDIPLPYYRALAPTRVLSVLKVTKAQPEGVSLTPAEEMERATTLEPAPPNAVSWSHPAVLRVSPQSSATGVSIVLDFGKEVSGFPLLVVRKGGGGRVDLGYSERIEADGTVNPNRWGGCDVHYADRLQLRPGFQRYEPLDHRAFRYLRLDIYDNPEPLELVVEMTVSAYPVAYEGDFQCSDPFLERIWQVGRYTTELCMDDGFMDCPWRERGQWLGDMRVEMLVAAYAFGDTALARKALLQYAQGQRESGWFPGVYPADPPFDSVLPTFCCLWLVALWEYFLLTDDRTLLEAVWENVERLVAALLKTQSEEGLLADLPHWVFIDWAPNLIQARGENAAVNALAVEGLLSAAKVARALGFPERGGDLEIAAAEIKEALNDLLWDAKRGVYRDGIMDGDWVESISEHANVLCALHGVADARQTASILNALFETPDDLPLTRIGTPYFDFFLTRLLYAQGRHDQALAYMRQKWGFMLEQGATTFWEKWEPHDSLCHAWSATPTLDLMAQTAGIRPLQPGFEEFTIAPTPGTLSWLRCTVPTPRGAISLAYHLRSDEPIVASTGNVVPSGATSPALTAHLTVPTGTLAHVRLPLSGLATPQVALNGKTIWEQGKPLPEAHRFRREGDALVCELGGGRYLFEAERT